MRIGGEMKRERVSERDGERLICLSKLGLPLFLRQKKYLYYLLDVTLLSPVSQSTLSTDARLSLLPLLLLEKYPSQPTLPPPGMNLTI
jgi:hypothetical protein